MLFAVAELLVFLNTMHEVKAQRSGELFVKNVLILRITLQNWTWKLEIYDYNKTIQSEKNSLTNFHGKFPNS